MTHACIYHKSDLDGIGSAAIVLRKHPQTEMFPAEYNQEPYTVSDFIDKDVIIVDFCPEKIREIKDVAKSFTWIDHHIGNKEKYPDLFTGDIYYSAIYLTWEYFYPNEDIPLVVELVQDYDIWKFRFGNMTRAFQEYGGMVLRTPENDAWNKLFMDDNETKTYTNKGQVLLDARVVSIENSFNAVIEKQLWGYKVGVVNSNKDVSELGNYIATHGYDIGLIWRVVKEGHVIVGLRSTEVDVSTIAKQYGGGGHKLASGFSIGLKRFCEEILE